MATTLRMTRSLIAGLEALFVRFASLLNRTSFLLRLQPAAQRLAGPHLGSQTRLPPRWTARQVIDASGAVAVRGLSKSEAEDLLDWLEVHHYHIHELDCAATGFIVRYS